MKKRTIAIVAAPLILVALAIAAFLAIPLLYYGNMFLVIALDLKPKPQEIPGNYSVSTEWGTAMLDVRANHTFAETIRSLKFGNRTIDGTWAYETQYPSSVGTTLTFKPFVGILYDKPQQYSYATQEFDINFIGQISAEQDPDWGISFYKDKSRK